MKAVAISSQPTITRTKDANDNATPSGNGTLVGVFARMYYLTGDESYRIRAESIIKTFAREVARNFFPPFNHAELR